MKNKFLTLVLLTLTLALKTFAAPPPTVPIENIHALRLYVADSAAAFNAGVYSYSGVQHKDRVTYFEGKIEGAGIYGLTNSIAKQTHFTVPFANPNDRVFFWVDVYDEKGELIFTGVSGETPTLVTGDQYRLDGASPELTMQSKIRLTGFKGAYNARVMVSDSETGRTDRSFALDVDQASGSIMFPKALVGKGYMEVYYQDGTSVLYGPDGKLTNKKIGTGIITPSLANSFVFINTTNLVIGNIYSYRNQGVNPSIQLRLDKEQVVLIGGQTTEGVWARGLMYRKAGRDHRNDPLQPVTFEKGGVAEGSYLLQFPAGDWLMYLTWDKELFSERDEQYVPDDNGGGKG